MNYHMDFTYIEPKPDAIYLTKNSDWKDIRDAIGQTNRDVMFPAGETFYVNYIDVKTGVHSPDTPRLIGVYGEGDRPTLKIGDGTSAVGFTAIGDAFYSPILSNIIIQGLHLTDYRRNYNSTEYDPSLDGAETYGLRWLKSGDNIRFEDCRFSYFRSSAIGSVNSIEWAPTNVQIHRCIFDHSWSSRDRTMNLVYGTARPNNQSRTGTGIIITDSVFYHGGWRPGQQRSAQSHNIYIDDPYLRFEDPTHSNPSAPCYIHNIISIAGASHGMKCHPGGEVQDSFFDKNAIGFFVSGNDSKVNRNVITRGTDLWTEPGATDRGNAFESFWLNDIEFNDNIMCHRDSFDANSRAVALRARQNAKINRNVLWEWSSSENEFTDIVNADPSNYGNIEGPGRIKVANPDISLATYAQHKLGISEEKLIDKMINRPRGVWDKTLEAKSINSYFRNRFNIVAMD